MLYGYGNQTMKITGTMSFIEVEIDNKIIKIDGEMTIGRFVASIKSMNPHENESFNDEIKESIIKEVENYKKILI